MKVVYKVTYPNGKIYVGLDLADSIGCFGSPSNELIAHDFTRSQRRSFTDKKEILWEPEVASNGEARRIERELIVAHRSNEPAIGYNQWPMWRKKPN